MIAIIKKPVGREGTGSQRNASCVGTFFLSLHSCISNGQPVFSLSDMKNLINQIRDTENATAESMARQEAAVREVYQFCDNTSECRRVQILQHFDERFDKKDCTKSCDVCAENRETVPTNVTMPAHTVLRLIQTIAQQRREKVTKNQLIAIVRGNNTNDVRSKNHETLPGYGACKDMDRDLLELMFNRLEFMEVLASVSEKNRANFHNTYTVVCIFLAVFCLVVSILFTISWVHKRGPSCSAANPSSWTGTLNLTEETYNGRRLLQLASRLVRQCGRRRASKKSLKTIPSNSSMISMTWMTTPTRLLSAAYHPEPLCRIHHQRRL